MKKLLLALINNGHEPITISKGDKICQMLVRPLYPSKMEIVEDIEDTGRGGYGSTGK